MLTTKVQIGKLDRRIVIQAPVYENNDHNEDTITDWQTIATVWARAEQRQGSEVIDAERLTYYETTLFTIRHRTDLNVRMRVVFGTVPYRIFSITEHESGRNGYMVIASEVMDNMTVVTSGEFSAAEFSDEFAT